MRTFAIAALAALTFSFIAPAVHSAEDDALSKFPEEKLIDIGFCFDEFCKAVAAKDAKVAAAFLAEMPASLAKLDLKKDADKETFVKYFAKFNGANIEKAQKMHGMGEVTYKDKDGRDQTQRMQLRAGVWKLTGI